MEDKLLLETLEFQANYAYVALERAMDSLFLPDAEHANVIYRESMGPLLRKMIEDEQGKKTYWDYNERKRDFSIINYARSEFERFVLEYSVGVNLSKDITLVNSLSNHDCWDARLPDREIAKDIERDYKLSRTKMDMMAIPKELEDFANSYKNGSWKDNRDCGLDESGHRPKKTPYRQVDMIIAAATSSLHALGDCPQSREIIKRVNVIPKIRELYLVK